VVTHLLGLVARGSLAVRMDVREMRFQLLLALLCAAALLGSPTDATPSTPVSLSHLLADLAAATLASKPYSVAK